jgi:hypothetical protein
MPPAKRVSGDILGTSTNRMDLRLVPKEAIRNRATESVSHSLVTTEAGLELRRSRYPLYAGLGLFAVGVVALVSSFTVGREMPLAIRIFFPAVFAWGGLCGIAFYLVGRTLGTRVVFDRERLTVTVFRGHRQEVQFPLHELAAVQLCYWYDEGSRPPDRYELNLVRATPAGAISRILLMSNFTGATVSKIAQRLAHDLDVDLLDAATPERRGEAKAGSRMAGYGWLARVIVVPIVLAVIGSLFCLGAALMETVFKLSYERKLEHLRKDGSFVTAVIEDKKIYTSPASLHGGGRRYYTIYYLPVGRADSKANWIDEEVSPKAFEMFSAGQNIHAWILGNEHVIQ